MIEWSEYKRLSTTKKTLKTMTLPAVRVNEDQQIAFLLNARHVLQQARDLGNVKKIVDAAAAAEIFAKRQHLSEETIGLAYALKIEALAKLGAILKETPRADGGDATRRARFQIGTELTPTLADLGIYDRKISMIAVQLASLPDETIAAIANREIKLYEALRRQRRAERPPVSLPSGTFRVLYADPPWAYENTGADEDDSWGRAGKHYPTMSIDDLCALPVRDIVAADAVLFLWVTSPLLAECWPVIDAWGFTYKASIVWDKAAHVFGHYVAVQHELLLICTRGSCLPDHPTPMPPSVMTIRKSRTHSEKPDAFRALIDQLYDGGADQKVELFSRRPVPGWTMHGNEPIAATV